MPIEYAPQWTGEMEIGMEDYERYVADRTALYVYNANKRDFINALLDFARTGDNKYFDKAQKILAKNPNFSISINGGKSVAGNAAAAAFRGAMAIPAGDPQNAHIPEGALTLDYTAVRDVSRDGAPTTFPHMAVEVPH